MTPDEIRDARLNAAIATRRAAWDAARVYANGILTPTAILLYAAANCYGLTAPERRILGTLVAIYNHEHRADMVAELWGEIAEIAQHAAMCAEDDAMNGDGWTAAQESAAEALADAGDGK